MTTAGARLRYPIISPTLPDPSELLDDIRAVFNSGRVTLGSHVAAFEADVCARTGVRHTVAVSSGTSGLMLLLRALDLPADSEVITPSFTFAATSHALLWSKLRPVFCDSEPLSFTLDADAAERLITPRTSAIYPVCVFGVPGDIDAYRQLADRRGLALLFDSAQGLGSTYKGTALGNFGLGEVFSLSPTKVVTAMEGGLVTTNDDLIAERLRHLRDYGKGPDGEDMRWLGLSARMPEINALIGRWSLAHLETWIANRRSIAERYRERLGRLEGVGFQEVPAHCTSCRNYVVIVLEPEECPISRDELYAQLKERGVQTKRYFYPALHNQSLYCEIEPGCARRLPVAERLSSRSLALPMYSHMPLQAVDEICDEIVDLVNQAATARAFVYQRSHILVSAGRIVGKTSQAGPAPTLICNWGMRACGSG